MTGTSEKTVKNHMTHIFEKLGVESRNAATVRALEVLSSPAAKHRRNGVLSFLMKGSQELPILPMIMLLAVSAHGQGMFQDLDFEAANLLQTQAPGLVATTDALPGWTVFYGTDQQSQVVFNTFALGSTQVSVLGINTAGYRSIEGGFSALLQGGGTATDASIRQTGLVPAMTQSIRFKAAPGMGTFVLLLNGQNVSFLSLSTGPNHTVYGADIAAFAAQTVELRFAALQDLSGPNNWNLDSIEFSTQPVPEPSILALFCLGIWLLGWRIAQRGDSRI